MGTSREREGIVIRKGYLRDFWGSGSFLFLDWVVSITGVHGFL